MPAQVSEKQVPDADNRYLPRWEVQNRVLYQLENSSQTWEGQTRDLSCAGACIRIDKSITPQQKVKMTVYLKNTLPLELKGHVVWIRPVGSENEIGVNFYGTSDEVQDLLLQHAFEVDKEALIRHWYKGW